jgi:hypothetical protein
MPAAPWMARPPLRSAAWPSWRRWPARTRTAVCWSCAWTILTHTAVRAASGCLVITAQLAGTAEAGAPPSRAVVLATGLPDGLELVSSN